MITGRNILSYSGNATDYIPLAEAKQHLRVNQSNDDAYISGLIEMALQTCSQYVGYSIRKASVQYGFDSLVGQPAIMNPVNGTALPVGNLLRVPSRVLSITSFQYVDENNAVQTFSDYIVSPEPFGQYGRTLFIESTPTTLTDDVTKYLITVTEGFETASGEGINESDVFPAAIKYAALLLVGQYYDNRQSIVTGTIQSRLEYGFQYLLDAYKINTFI